MTTNQSKLIQTNLKDFRNFLYVVWKHLKLPEYNADGSMVGVIYNDKGKAIGGTPTLLPATTENIKIQAEILGTTERILRKGLLDEHNKKYGKN